MDSSTPKAQAKIAGMGLHGVPKEIQAKILNELGVDDLFVCQEVCRLWKAIIQDTSSIQYKIALVASGMQDCPSRSSIADRSRSMREYLQAAWDTEEIPYRTHPAPRKSRQFYVHASDVFAYAAREENDQRSLTIYRPAAPYMGIVEKSWKIDTRNYFSTVDDIGSCTVDVAQDLIVLTALQENEIPRCYLLSLSRGGGHHPLAAEIELEGDDTVRAGMPLGELVEEIAVVGDLIEWTIFGEWTSMYVFNWKTGELVWSFDIQSDYAGVEVSMQNFDMRCRIVDSSHVLAILGTDIYVCNMDDFNPDDDTESSLIFICHLQLPLLATGCDPNAIECYIQRPPTTSSDCPPHFECNPDLTVLVLRYGISIRAGENSSVIVFIPLSTIHTLANQDRDTASPMVIPWEEWVDLGARVICLPSGGSDWPSISTMGSRVALTFDRKSTEKDAEVLLFDLHPHARIGAPSTGLDTAQVLISDYYTSDIAPIFRYPVRSTLPYRVVKKTIPPGRRGGVYLMQDEIKIFTPAVENS